MATNSIAVALVRAERTKWRSTRLVLKYGSVAVGLSVAITALLGLAMAQAHAACARPDATCSKPPFLAPDTIVTAGLLGDGTPGAGLIALMLLGAATMLVEYRHGTLGATFLATPQRLPVVFIKAALALVAAFVLAALAALASGTAFLFTGGGSAQSIEPWSVASLGISVRTAAVIAFAAVGAVGLAALMRNTVAVVTMVVMWPLIVEPLLPSLIPGVGATVAGLLPFINARSFIGLGGSGADIPWDPVGSGLYFACWMLGLLVLGALSIRRATVR